MMRFTGELLYCMAAFTTKGRPPALKSDFVYLFEEGCTAAFYEHGVAMTTNYKGEVPTAGEQVRAIPYSLARECKPIWFTDVELAVPSPLGKGDFEIPMWTPGKDAHMGETFIRKLAALYCAWSQVGVKVGQDALFVHAYKEPVEVECLPGKKLTIGASATISLPLDHLTQINVWAEVGS